MGKFHVEGVPYEVCKLLGKGKGGYVYLAYDPNGREVALKQIHHEPCDYYTFGDKFEAELRDYRRLQDAGILMPRLIQSDRKNERIVKEYISGPLVYDLVLEDKLPDSAVRALEEMCARLYPAGLNIDYFPTNFVLSEGRLYYVDYECNPYDEKWDFEHWGRKYWSKTPDFLAHAFSRGG